MKALFRTYASILLGPGLLLATAHPALAANPTVSGPWVDLRKAPLFEAPAQPLAPTWGPALDVGTAFRVQKVYGRWLFGSPEPPARMRQKDFAPPGWVFSRTLLLPGDKDTLPAPLVREARAVLYHGRPAGTRANAAAAKAMDFYESLTLSRGTLDAFRRQDEAALALPFSLPKLFSFASATASAEETPGDAPVGLSGTDLRFLDQEFKVILDEKSRQARAAESKKLHPPKAPALDGPARLGILGRFMMQKYFETPSLTHEEVDGFVYMRATALRALEGCPAQTRNFWQNRRWNHFRVFRLRSRPEQPNPWLEAALPGGYFAFSARAIELAGNEAELAFLLVRPLVREPRLKRPVPKMEAKNWPAGLDPSAELAWSQALKAQSTKDSDHLDVADEIAVDLAALECISRAGYRPLAGLSYLRKLHGKRAEPWAEWYREHYLGTEYRLDRVSELLDEALAKKSFPAGTATNPKRFSTAARHWNLLP